MNEHPYELLRVGRAKVERYEREAAWRSQVRRGSLRHHFASLLRALAAHLEPEAAQDFTFERTF